MEKGYRNGLLGYFRKCFKNSIEDVNALLKAVDREKRYAVIVARKYISWLIERGILNESVGEKYLRILKYKKKRNHIDVFVYSDDDVKRLYKNIADDKVRLYFEILLFSGIRMTELSKMLSEFDEKKLAVVNNQFIRYELNYVRGEKKGLFVYMPISLKPKLKRYYKVNADRIKKELLKYNVKGKVLRKVNYNKLLLAGISESIADYIQGRVADRIGARHYANLLMQADNNYPKALPLLKRIIK